MVRNDWNESSASLDEQHVAYRWRLALTNWQYKEPTYLLEGMQVAFSANDLC